MKIKAQTFEKYLLLSICYTNKRNTAKLLSAYKINIELNIYLETVRMNYKY